MPIQQDQDLGVGLHAAHGHMVVTGHVSLHVDAGHVIQHVTHSARAHVFDFSAVHLGHDGRCPVQNLRLP